jgi:hypothetical protein
VTTSTENLIDGLVDRLAPMPARLIERRLAMAVLGGGAIVFALVIGLTGFRSDLSTAVGDFDFWAKLVYAAALAMIALAAARHLARPEVSGIKMAGFAVPVVALLLLAVVELGTAAADQRSALIFGNTWRECPLLIAAFSLPLLAVLMRLFTGFAPQRPRLTGAIIGVAAGATTAMIYSLHCPETAMTFLLLWYSAGVAIIAAIGAIIGPRILRW